jgi:hypothetical protein
MILAFGLACLKESISAHAIGIHTANRFLTRTLINRRLGRTLKSIKLKRWRARWDLNPGISGSGGLRAFAVARRLNPGWATGPSSCLCSRFVCQPVSISSSLSHHAFLLPAFSPPKYSMTGFPSSFLERLIIRLRRLRISQRFIFRASASSGVVAQL